MATRTHNVKAFLNDRINDLNGVAVEALPAKQVFGTVNTILALVRVRTVALRPSAGSRSHQ